LAGVIVIITPSRLAISISLHPFFITEDIRDGFTIATLKLIRSGKKTPG
jgi:hypothetical protein